ncbi:HlyD family secretion protein [Rhodovulum visakhapatnamense]|uniref:HlyD family secretion protein n=1 Tax=Rhodovulum visakhapatnamense TaxID=364297 RepID=A0A4R8FFL6_9RHOB|nr:HlyD family efflux transporter periplasmic adaptor subunit [Rhodovulum visakhapatnamense]TDX24740.1 HlyD family secretion protein [Rhodovulum visakhapatnamense]
MRLQIGLTAVAIFLAAGGYILWTQSQDDVLPVDIAYGNGQIEAVQVDISSMVAGRIETVSVREGDMVTPGQVVSTVDAKIIEAQLAQAKAQIAAAEAERAAAQAQIGQMEALLALAQEEEERSRALVARGTSPQSNLDTLSTNVAVAEANLEAARAALLAHERAVDAARAAADQIAANLEDTELTAPTVGRILYRLVEPGEIISAGARVMTMVDLSEVYLEFYLPATQAHRLAIGDEARIKLDVVDAVVPAIVTFVSPVSQFTPRTVETADERQNLVFRVRARVPQELVEAYIDYVRTGIRGVAYVRLAPEPGQAPSDWPAELQLADLSNLPLPLN